MAEEEKHPATCKFCGAIDPQLLGQSWYECGTHFADYGGGALPKATDDSRRGFQCLLRQIAALVRQRDKLEQALKDILDKAEKGDYEGDACTVWCIRDAAEYVLAEIKKEKEGKHE